MKRTSYMGGWKMYRLCMVGHHLQGAAVAIAALSGTANVIAGAALWTALYMAYQGLSVLRKQDSPGLDIADFMAGFGLGLVAYLAWMWTG